MKRSRSKVSAGFLADPLAGIVWHETADATTFADRDWGRIFTAAREVMPGVQNPCIVVGGQQPRAGVRLGDSGASLAGVGMIRCGHADAALPRPRRPFAG